MSFKPSVTIELKWVCIDYRLIFSRFFAILWRLRLTRIKFFRPTFTRKKMLETSQSSFCLKIKQFFSVQCSFTIVLFYLKSFNHTSKSPIYIIQWIFQWDIYLRFFVFFCRQNHFWWFTLLKIRKKMFLLM